MTNTYQKDQRAGSNAETIVHAIQIENEQRADQGWGILAGLTSEMSISADGSGMEVRVESGSAEPSGVFIRFAGPSVVAVAASDGSGARLDSLILTPGSVLSVTTGTTESEAGRGDYFPADLNTGEMLLALVFVAAGANVINDSDVVDKRVFVATAQPSTSVVTSDRAVNTDFQNNTGKMLLVTASVKLTVDNTQDANVQAKTDGTSTPAVVVAEAFLDVAADQDTIVITAPLTFAVRPGDFYAVDAVGNGGAGTPALVVWTEVIIT